MIEAGRRLAAHGGAYDVVEANTKERGEVEAALKAARSSTKAASPRSGATQRHTDAASSGPRPWPPRPPPPLDERAAAGGRERKRSQPL